jgi:hypothetical protein
MFKRFAADLVVAAATVCAVAPAAADTVVLLNDTFDSEHGGVGAAEYSGFAHFVGANVDLLAPGYFFNLCQSAGGGTPCVDMEGSGNGSLATKAYYDFGPGFATLQFDLAGDQRGHSNNTVTVALTSDVGATLFSETFDLASDAGFTTFSRSVPIASAVSARLSFLSGGPADSYGMLLDNVVLSAGTADIPSAVPEPETYALMLGGLGALGLVARRRQRPA